MRTSSFTVLPYKWSDDLSSAHLVTKTDGNATLVLESKLGAGAYGTVFKSRSTRYPAHVCAAKLFSRNKNDPAASEDKLKLELDALLAVSPSPAAPSRSPSCVVSFYGTVPLDEVHFGADANVFARDDLCHTVLLMEYINGGTLTSWLKQYDDVIDFDCMLCSLRQCAAAVCYTHEEAHLLHRDIKPANFLIRVPHMPTSADDHITDSSSAATARQYLLHHSELVLTDFGEATSCKDDSEAGSLRKILGTPGFCAPEILKVWGCQADCLYGKKADIWSLGAMFYVYLALGAGACDQGMLSIFSAVGGTSSLFSSEAVSILLLSKCVFPSLMQLRYGAFTVPETDGSASVEQQPNQEGTLAEDVYTRYTAMDEGATALDQWRQHVEQFAKMQRHLQDRWPSVPDAILQMIDRMMSQEPSQRPAAPVLLNCLKGVGTIPKPPPCHEWSCFLAFQALTEWHVLLMDVESCLEELVTTLHGATKVDTHTIQTYLPSISQFKTYVREERAELPSLHTSWNESASFVFSKPVPTPETLLDGFSQAYVTEDSHSSVTICSIF